jgi:hypothetical protein
LKPKLIALNLMLAAGVLVIGWQARVRWQEWQAQRKANLNVRIRTVNPPTVAPVPKPEAPTAVKYADVATKNLFAVDRNPTVIIDPPPPAPPPKPMPPLPVVYGTMGLPSGIKAIMAAKPGETSVAVRTGDTIGEFKILALSPQKVTFEWNEKQVERRIEDLADRSGPAANVAQGPAAPTPGPAAPAPQPAAQSTNSNPSVGVVLTATERACRPGESSPAGTVADGYKKTITLSPFGAICRWVKQ